MRVFQEEIFGPVVSVTKFKDEAHALEIANDTLYGLRCWCLELEMGTLPTEWAELSRQVAFGLTATMLTRLTAPFGGYKQSGVGRETHKMMLNHYRQVKNLHVSYSEKIN